MTNNPNVGIIESLGMMRVSGVATVKYKRDFKALEQRRRKGMKLLARGVTQAEVAREMDVSRQTVSMWERARQADPQAWRRGSLGRPGGLTDAEQSRLAKALLAGAVAAGFPTELWTLARVAQLIEREFDRTYSTVHVWRLLKQLGFSSQRPVGRAIQRDEAAILEWKQKRWPQLKKKPVEKAEPSSSSTSRGSRNGRPG
jgi:transposase